MVNIIHLNSNASNNAGNTIGPLYVVIFHDCSHAKLLSKMTNLDMKDTINNQSYSFEKK